jgi:hypothetical protein
MKESWQMARRRRWRRLKAARWHKMWKRQYENERHHGISYVKVIWQWRNQCQ